MQFFGPSGFLWAQRSLILSRLIKQLCMRSIRRPMNAFETRKCLRSFSRLEKRGFDCLDIETKFSGTNARGKLFFFCSADHVQDWQPYPVDPYSSCYMSDHTYLSPRHLKHFPPSRIGVLAFGPRDGGTNTLKFGAPLSSPVSSVGNAPAGP